MLSDEGVVILAAVLEQDVEYFPNASLYSNFLCLQKLSETVEKLVKPH